MLHPKVSIIMPVYNGSNFIEKAINSALCQTYDNIEIIVVNDGSSDGGKTDSIAKKFGSRIIYIDRKENKGIAATLNEGIRNMTGDYFTWLSHDDMYVSTKIEEQVAFLNEIAGSWEGVDITRVCLCGGSETIDVEDRVIRKRKMQKRSTAIRTKKQQILDNLDNYGIGGCTVMIPRGAFEEVGMFDDSWRTVQDANMWYRLILSGYYFCYLNKRLVRSRAHEGETGRRLINVFTREKAEFQVWLTKQMIEQDDLQDWKFFLKCGLFQKKMEHNKAACNSFCYAKRLCNSPYYNFYYIPFILYGTVYEYIRKSMKWAYWKFVVKRKIQ